MKTSEKTAFVKTWEKTSQQNLVRHKFGRYYCSELQQEQRDLEEFAPDALFGREGAASRISARALNRVEVSVTAYGAIAISPKSPRFPLTDRRVFVIIYRNDAFARIPALHFSGGIFAGGG